MALIAFIESRACLPHDFASNDCIRYVLGGVEAQFGSSPWPNVDWHDERSARRAIAKVGGIEAETDRLFETIEPSQAEFGDIAGARDHEGAFHLLIVEGALLSAPGECRLERRPRTDMIRAWRAGPGVRAQ
ncbi:hypothetical protein AAG607_12050 [Citromicrobium bathyomarinum]|uniref:DUF6950 family protein n=1 Tax=Citromicrobium bathyomarinum TaxID=72174 RepID=UPI00315AE047